MTLPRDPALRRRIADGSDRSRAEGYDVLRTRLLAAMAPRGWSRVGVTQGRAGKAAPLTALNLALSKARQMQQRVVLVDLDIARQPVLRLLGAPIPPDATDKVPVLGRRLSDQLALVVIPAPAPQAATVLLSPDFTARLQDFIAGLAPDVVIMSLPPMLQGDAGLAGLGLVQTVLLTIDGRADTAATLRDCETRIGDLCPVVGVFLHDAEA